jgi:hypothetical protein
MVAADDVVIGDVVTIGGRCGRVVAPSSWRNGTRLADQ